MLLYIHGYQGSPGGKFELVRKVFGGIYPELSAPQLDNTDVRADLERLSALLPLEEKTDRTCLPHLIVGNSLGGFYAWCLCHRRRDSMALIINPSLAPFISLKRIPGISASFFRDLLQCFSDTFQSGRCPRIWAAYCLDDEVLDHRATTELILSPFEGESGTKPGLFPVDHGGHGFENPEALRAAFEAVRRDILAGCPQDSAQRVF